MTPSGMIAKASTTPLTSAGAEEVAVVVAGVAAAAVARATHHGRVSPPELSDAQTNSNQTFYAC